MHRDFDNHKLMEQIEIKMLVKSISLAAAVSIFMRSNYQFSQHA